MFVCGIVGPFEDYVKEELLRVAREISEHYMSVPDNEIVLEVTYYNMNGVAIPDEWRYLGDSSDAIHGQCLGRPGYIGVNTNRIDHIIEVIKGGEKARIR